jgi:hypothetical protein
MVLVVSHHADEHASSVLGELTALGTPSKLVDLGQFPQRIRLGMRYSSAEKREFTLAFSDGTTLRLDECRTIWWRRPQQFELDPGIANPGHRNFCWNECCEAFRGLWPSVEVFWVNNPSRDDIAHRKAFQLRVAQEVGLRIPKTLISNDPEAATEFIKMNGVERTIYKAFSATEEDWRETRVLRQDEMKLLDNVRHAPVIFQEYIDAQYDLRVTIIGKQIFAAAIYSQESAYRIDFRMDVANTRIQAVELPEDIKRKLHAFMDHLGLQYGAIDMRLTPDAEHVFLEINPAGQWLFIEQCTRQPISAALAKLLSNAQ